MSHVWNFAYGGNMNPRILLGRRGIRPAESAAARLEGYRLAFNLPGIPWLEPAFANVVPRAGAVVHGVLHRLSREQMARLDRFEGGGVAYRHLELEVEAYDGRRLRARVYSAIRITRERRPSCRYLNILREGARHFALDPDYIRMLDAQPCWEAIRIPEPAFRAFEAAVRLGFAMRRRARRLLSRRVHPNH